MDSNVDVTFGSYDGLSDIVDTEYYEIHIRKLYQFVDRLLSTLYK